MLEPVQSFRVVESDPAASLHPYAIWKHWEKHVIWDPRTYYGLIQCVGLLALFFNGIGLVQGTFTGQYLLAGAIMVVAIAPLLVIIFVKRGSKAHLGCDRHWYSIDRVSSHILTRTRTHMVVLLWLSVALLVLQTVALFMGSGDDQCNWYRNYCDVKTFLEMALWASIGFCLFAAYILYSQARARVHPFIAELPFAAEDENGERRHATDWADAGVAEGIPDDSPEPEGQVRL